MVIRPIDLNNIDCSISDDNIRLVKSNISVDFLLERGVKAVAENDQLVISGRKCQSHSLYRRILSILSGITSPYTKVLTLVGAGYWAKIDNNILELQVGYAHIIKIPIDPIIQVKIEKNNIITASSYNSQVLGTFVSTIEHKRFHNPYTHKGILIQGKTYITKVRKKGTKGKK